MRQSFNLWMITILFASVIVISATTPHDPVVHWKQHFSNREAREGVIETYSNPKPNISEFPSSRFRRNSNDDAFSTLQSRISSLARIVSGVTLYNGLVDGSIPVDEAISELMNIGSFSLDELMKFDPGKVAGFVEQLKVASTKMSDNSHELETAMVDLVKVKEMWSEVGNLDGLPDDSKFGNLQALKSLDLQVIEDFDLLTLSKLVLNVPNFKSDLKKIAEASENALKLMEEKEVLKTLTGMTPFHRYVNILLYVSQQLPHKKLIINPDAMKADFKILQGISNDGAPILHIIKGITSSQSGNHFFERKHTTGFVNGFVDLKMLTQDSDNTWLRENFKWLNLTDGLTTISNLEKDMQNLNGEWKKLGKDSIRRAVEQAQFFESELKGVGNTLSLVDNVISELNKLPKLSYIANYCDELKETSKKTLDMLKKVEAIQEISVLLKKNKKLISEIDASNPSSVQNIIPLLEAINFQVEIVKKGDKVKDIAQFLTIRPTDYTEIETSASSKSFQAFFNALKNYKGDHLNKVATAAEFSIRLRELKNIQDFSSDVGTASSIASGSVGWIERIRIAMGDIKKSSADKNQAFSQLKDLQKFSKPLGDSSAVIDKIRKVLTKEKQLMDLGNGGKLLSQMIQSGTILISDPNRKIFNKNWASFDEDSQKCTLLLGEVKKRRDGVVKPSDDKIESYGSIIEGLDGLPDVVVDVNRLMIALDASSQSVTRQDIKSKLINLKNSLTELGSLDLSFTRQSSSLRGMSQVLAGINNVFLSTTPATTENPKTGENGCGAQDTPEDGKEDLDNGEPPQYKDTSTKEKSGNDVVYWICIGLLCTVVGGCIITFVVWVVKINIQAYRRQKRYKEEHKEEIAKARRMSDYIAGRVRSPGRRSYPVSKPPLSEDQ